MCGRVVDEPTCAGRPGAFGRVRVVVPDPERGGSPDALVRRGETDELIVAMDSPETLIGDWRRPDADARAIRGGWYFTGIWSTRTRRATSTRWAASTTRVAEACVVGLPDARGGRIVAAFLVPRSGPDGAPVALASEERDRFCREARDFASFKRPRRYEFVPALPKSPAGKLLRRRWLGS